MNVHVLYVLYGADTTLNVKISNHNQKFKIYEYALTNFELWFVKAASCLTLSYSILMRVMRKCQASKNLHIFFFFCFLIFDSYRHSTTVLVTLLDHYTFSDLSMIFFLYLYSRKYKRCVLRDKLRVDLKKKFLITILSLLGRLVDWKKSLSDQQTFLFNVCKSENWQLWWGTRRQIGM